MKVTSVDAPKSFRALIVATLLVIMLLNMTLLLPVSPVLAESESGEQTCTDSCCVSSTIISGDRTYERLTLSELRSEMAKALADSGVRALQLAFMKRGYTPRYNDAEAFKTTITNENGNFWVIATALPFDSDAYSAAIIYFDFGQDDTFLGVSMSSGLVNYKLDENTWNVTLSGLDENGQLTTIAQRVVISSCGDWLCLLICGFVCAFGCGAGCVAICGAICGPLCVGCIWIWSCPACLICALSCGGICAGLCYLISIYGCSPGCDWLCCQL